MSSGLSVWEGGGSGSEELKNAFPLPLQSCDPWMVVKKNRNRKKNWTLYLTHVSCMYFLPNLLKHTCQKLYLKLYQKLYCSSFHKKSLFVFRICLFSDLASSVKYYLFDVNVIFSLLKVSYNCRFIRRIYFRKLTKMRKWEKKLGTFP